MIVIGSSLIVEICKMQFKKSIYSLIASQFLLSAKHCFGHFYLNRLGQISIWSKCIEEKTVGVCFKVPRSNVKELS